MVLNQILCIKQRINTVTSVQYIVSEEFVFIFFLHDSVSLKHMMCTYVPVDLTIRTHIIFV